MSAENPKDEIQMDIDEQQVNAEETENETTPPNSVNSAILKTIVVCLVIFIVTIIADRTTPYTDLARINGFVIPVTTYVGGELTEVNVEVNSIVKKGDVLARINEKDYKIAVDKAQAQLDQAVQSVGGDSEMIFSAEAKVASAKAQLENYRIQARRVFELEKRGVLARAESDMARAELAKAKAALEEAQAELQGKLAQLGEKGEENPRTRQALAVLRDAKLNLSRTAILAPSDGGVTDLQVRQGNIVKQGQAIMTFISSTDIWIEAAMRENSIGNIDPGDKVDIALDIAPGRVFPGTVVSLGFGVATGKENAPGSLPFMDSQVGWLRDPQRFPVIIAFSDNSTKGLRRVGGQADVIVYAKDNFIFKALGWIWIRLMSLLSYAR